MDVPSSMRAVLLREIGGPLTIEEVAVPTPGMGEVLIRVRACAVDRFDLAIRKGGREQPALPHILGHEVAGEVAVVGSEATGWKSGDRVAMSLYLVCGSCRWCRKGRETICERFGGHLGVNIPGGYAEYVVVPARNLVRLSSAIEFPAASILANAIGTPLHAISARMGLTEGERLVVTGGGGGVGLHAVQIGAMLGAEVMAVDLGAAKLTKASQMGASRTVDPSIEDLGAAIQDWTDGVGVDAVLELVGTATMPATLAGLAKGGRLVVVGSHTGTDLSVDMGLMYRNEWEIRGSRNVSVAELAKVVDLVDRGLVKPIVEEVHPWEDAEILHQRVASGVVIGRDVLVS